MQCRNFALLLRLAQAGQQGAGGRIAPDQNERASIALDAAIGKIVSRLRSSRHSSKPPSRTFRLARWPSRGFRAAAETRSRGSTTRRRRRPRPSPCGSEPNILRRLGSRNQTAARQSDRWPRPAARSSQYQFALQQRQRTEFDNPAEHQQRPVPEIERVTDQTDPHSGGLASTTRFTHAAGDDSKSAVPATGSNAHQPGKALGCRARRPPPRSAPRRTRRASCSPRSA